MIFTVFATAQSAVFCSADEIEKTYDNMVQNVFSYGDYYDKYKNENNAQTEIEILASSYLSSTNKDVKLSSCEKFTGIVSTNKIVDTIPVLFISVLF